jgi:hypothetical protein
MNPNVVGVSVEILLFNACREADACCDFFIFGSTITSAAESQARGGCTGPLCFLFGEPVAEGGKKGTRTASPFRLLSSGR